jgi:hypothetical protein
MTHRSASRVQSFARSLAAFVRLKRPRGSRWITRHISDARLTLIRLFEMLKEHHADVHGQGYASTSR